MLLYRKQMWFYDVGMFRLESSNWKLLKQYIGQGIYICMPLGTNVRSSYVRPYSFDNHPSIVPRLLSDRATLLEFGVSSPSSSDVRQNVPLFLTVL